MGAEKYSFEQIIDASGSCLLPGLVDAHTHPVWAGDRVHEFSMKVKGSYVYRSFFLAVLLPCCLSLYMEESENLLLLLFLIEWKKSNHQEFSFLIYSSFRGLRIWIFMKWAEGYTSASNTPEGPLRTSSTSCLKIDSKGCYSMVYRFLLLHQKRELYF